MPYSLEEDITYASEAGFEGIEIWYSKLKKYLENHSARDLKKLLESKKLKPAAICPLFLKTFLDGREDGRADMKKAAEVAKEIGCGVLLVCSDSPPKDMDGEEAYKKAAQEAGLCADMVKGYGVRLAIEPLGMHPFVPGPKEALRIVKESGRANIGIMMDTFHYYKSSVSMSEIKSLPIDKLLIVHVNGCEDLPKDKLKDSNRLYPGLGVIPAAEMLSAIKKNGYSGFLSVEVFREEYWKRAPKEISGESKEYLDRLMAAI